MNGYDPTRRGKGTHNSAAVRRKINVLENRSLEEAIVRAQAAGIGKNINIGNCPWAVITETRESLMQSMQLGKDSYLEKGTKSPPRQCLRQGFIFNQVVAPLVTLIPDEKGLNVLRAGLSMVFAVSSVADMHVP